MYLAKKSQDLLDLNVREVLLGVALSGRSHTAYNDIELGEPLVATMGPWRIDITQDLESADDMARFSNFMKVHAVDLTPTQRLTLAARLIKCAVRAVFCGRFDFLLEGNTFLSGARVLLECDD